jgi:hypothetical protein
MADGELCFEETTYIGCHNDDGNRDFGFGPQQYGYDSTSCREACAEYPYFALQNGGWCSCDYSYGNPEDSYHVRPDDDCGEADENGNRQGGGWANAVYSNNRYVEENDFTYIGCYNDDGHRDFDFGPQQYGYDQDSCREACDDYPFFALQNNGWCSCDYSYGSPIGTYYVKDDNLCRNA